MSLPQTYLEGNLIERKESRFISTFRSLRRELAIQKQSLSFKQFLALEIGPWLASSTIFVNLLPYINTPKNPTLLAAEALVSVVGWNILAGKGLMFAFEFGDRYINGVRDAQETPIEVAPATSAAD